VETLVVRILWLFGPPGVGKSVTAWELLNLLSDINEPTAYVDIDQLGMADPEARDEGDAHRRKTWALAAVGRVQAQRGATTLVVSGVLDPDQIEFSRRALADFDLVLVRLTVDEVVLKRRMDPRGQCAEDWSAVLADARRHEAAGHGLPVVGTDGGSPLDVARRVLDAARARPSASLSRADEPGPTTAIDPGRAVLITGSRMVGKSTIGWNAFMEARQKGITTAFLDLRQLGFHGREGGAIDHALQSAATGALWRVFRARGNQLLLLNGTTTDAAQVKLYADHLACTPLTTVRVTATPAELTARARARARGEMALLAGDDIVGATEDYLQQILDDARLTQDSSSADDIVLDTTSLAAAEAARMVLDLATT
jgi:adenylylsulfate kinase-like enzyme